MGLLANVDDAEIDRRRKRLRDALAAFDSATIATTHQFCQLVLRSLGVAGDTDSGAELVDSLDELVVEVVDDVYLRRFGQLAQAPPFKRDVALALARAAVGDPQAELAPADAEPDSTARHRVDFACEVRQEVDRRKRRRGVLSYDDLLAGSPTPSRSPTPRRANGCASAGRSCWSTSSRTPTRCSGRCSTGPSPGTRRWC